MNVQRRILRCYSARVIICITWGVNYSWSVCTLGVGVAALYARFILCRVFVVLLSLAALCIVCSCGCECSGKTTPHIINVLKTPSSINTVFVVDTRLSFLHSPANCTYVNVNFSFTLSLLAISLPTIYVHNISVKFHHNQFFQSIESIIKLSAL